MHVCVWFGFDKKAVAQSTWTLKGSLFIWIGRRMKIEGFTILVFKSWGRGCPLVVAPLQEEDQGEKELRGAKRTDKNENEDYPRSSGGATVLTHPLKLMKFQHPCYFTRLISNHQETSLRLIHLPSDQLSLSLSLSSDRKLLPSVSGARLEVATALNCFKYYFTPSTGSDSIYTRE